MKVCAVAAGASALGLSLGAALVVFGLYLGVAPTAADRYSKTALNHRAPSRRFELRK